MYFYISSQRKKDLKELDKEDIGKEELDKEELDKEKLDKEELDEEDLGNEDLGKVEDGKDFRNRPPCGWPQYFARRLPPTSIICQDAGFWC